jgi:hypothetical protein
MQMHRGDAGEQRRKLLASRQPNTRKLSDYPSSRYPDDSRYLGIGQIGLSLPTEASSRSFANFSRIRPLLGMDNNYATFVEPSWKLASGKKTRVRVIPVFADISRGSSGRNFLNL